MKYRIKFVPAGKIHSYLLGVIPFKTTVDVHIAQHKKWGLWWNIYAWCSSEEEALMKIEKFKRSIIITDVE